MNMTSAGRRGAIQPFWPKKGYFLLLKLWGYFNVLPSQTMLVVSQTFAGEHVGTIFRAIAVDPAAMVSFKTQVDAEKGRFLVGPTEV